MAKVTGVVSTFNLDNSGGTAVDISSYVTSITANTTQGQQDVTGLDKAALERLGLLKDVSIAIGGAWGTVLHNVLKAAPASNATRTAAIGFSNAAATLTAEVNAQDYNLSRGADGSLTWTATLVNANGNAPVWT